MSWNYRLMRHTEKHPFHEKAPDKFPETMVWYAIHEVFYNREGKPDGWTKEVVSLDDEEPENLMAAMKDMTLAFSKPILNYNCEHIAAEVGEPVNQPTDPAYPHSGYVCNVSDSDNED